MFCSGIVHASVVIAMHEYTEKVDQESQRPGVDFAGVIGAWQTAQQSAARRWHWQEIADGADGYLKIAEVHGREAMFMIRARANYLAAFLCAQDQRAVQGMVRAARGFARLGDAETARRCLAAADELARRETDGRKRAPLAARSKAPRAC